MPQPLITVVLPLDEANAALCSCKAAVDGGYDGDGSRAAAIAANGEGGWVRLREVVEELRTCDPLDIFKPQVGDYYADHIEQRFAGFDFPQGAERGCDASGKEAGRTRLGQPAQPDPRLDYDNPQSAGERLTSVQFEQKDRSA